ncbi:MAG: hypothetical protein V4534_03815 [Myxococcota bacterium]
MFRIEFLPLIPAGIALLLSFAPTSFLEARKSINIILQIFWFIFLVFLKRQGLLSVSDFSLLSVQILVLLGVKTENWLLIALSTASIVSGNFQLALLFAYLHVVMMFFMILQTGGLYKGSTSYQSIIFFLVIDLSAYFSLSVSHPAAYWIVLLPCLARTLFLVASPYARTVFYNCPTEVMILLLGSMVPIGISLLSKVPLPCPRLDILEVICMGSALFAAMLFLMERSRRQRAIYLFMAQSPLCIALILKKHPLGMPLCLLGMVNSMTWLYFLDKPKIRYLNIALAGTTVIWLVCKQ